MPLIRRTVPATVLLLTAGLAAAVVPATGAAAADPVDGPQTSGDRLFPNVGNGGYDAQHYDLDLAWTPGATLAASTLQATAEMTAETTGSPLRSFSLDFEPGSMTVSEVLVDGVPAAHTLVQDAEAIKHKIVVTPTAPVEGGFSVAITYAGVPTRHVDADGSFEGWNVTDDGATFLNQPIGSMTGYPNNNTPSDKATYTIDVDIPDTITNGAGTGAAAAASNGELVAREPSGTGRTTWRWVQEEPMASELAMISIGKYDVIEADVPLADGRTIREWSFVDSAISTTAKASINVQRNRWTGVLDGLAGIYGPYPGNSTGVVVDRVPGGISYALETQDRSFFPGSVNANTFVHEAAHQWYGNHVAPREWNDLWINEGMATWVPTWFNNEVDPPTSGTTTEGANYVSWNSSPADSANWTVPPAGMTDSADLYGYQSYTRGSQMWEALRLSIGDDDFFTFVRAWQDTYGGGSAGIEEFTALAEEVSGEDLDAFFTDWVRDADKPAWPQRFDLSLSEQAASRPVEPGSTVTYTLTAANRGLSRLTSSTASVELSDVLDDAELDPAGLPEGLTLDGDVLTWAVPGTARRARSEVSFDVTVDDAAAGSRLAAVASPTSLGGFCVSGRACTSDLGVRELRAMTLKPRPKVAGQPVVGRTLRAQPGRHDDGVRLSYRWLAGGRLVAGARGATLVLKPFQRGEAIAVRVVATKPGFERLVRTSAPTAPVR
ncbi:hypothetical protein GCM10009737_15520 [Nocardioides lentus]|uniref:Aminopeptidase N n=1 Tax=Nocardioides lentus TaxID=338077 RepID=A0ABP5AKW3_9ACTN